MFWVKSQWGKVSWNQGFRIGDYDWGDFDVDPIKNCFYVFHSHSQAIQGHEEDKLKIYPAFWSRMNCCSAKIVGTDFPQVLKAAEQN